jgi:hypothetical protein
LNIKVEKPADVEFLRTTLKAVSPHYPGFLVPEMAANIDALCDLALLGLTVTPAKDRP